MRARIATRSPNSPGIHVLARPMPAPDPPGTQNFGLVNGYAVGAPGRLPVSSTTAEQHVRAGTVSAYGEAIHGQEIS